jgi:catalase
MLQGSLFSYADTQMYRLGTNFNSLPINRPLVVVNSNNQDGKMNGGDRRGDVNYEPTSTASELTQPAKFSW